MTRLSLFCFLQLTVAADVDRDGAGLLGREVHTGAVEPLVTILTVAEKTRLEKLRIEVTEQTLL